jgi:hypothetical protein
MEGKRRAGGDRTEAEEFRQPFIEQALPGQLQGEARLIFNPAGLVCQVNIPVTSLQEPVIALV